MYKFSGRKPVFTFARSEKGSQVRVPTWEDFQDLCNKVESLEKMLEAKNAP